MNKKVKKVLKKYNESIENKFNIEEDLSDYSRLPFNKVNVENTRPEVKQVKRKNAILACCVSSVLSIGVMLSIMLPMMNKKQESSGMEDYDDTELITEAFDSESDFQVFNYLTDINRFTLYTGTVNSENTMLYVSKQKYRIDYQFQFFFNDTNLTFVENSNHFPIPDEPFELSFKVISETDVFVQSTINII